ncbi:hypothetical protein Tco_1314875 [Tanacetum coccineum]
MKCLEASSWCLMKLSMKKLEILKKNIKFRGGLLGLKDFMMILKLLLLRRPKQVKYVGSSKKSKIIESIIANNSKPNHSWGSNAIDVPTSSSLVNDKLSRLFSGTVRFENDQIAKIMGYGDHQLGNLAKNGLARGILKIRFKKDHLCSARALGKSKKYSHQSKAKDTNQEKLYLLHMDLCGPMRVESINGKKYILVIVYDYS